MKRLALLAVGLLAFSGEVMADRGDVVGVGANSCGQFTDQTSDLAFKAMYLSWAQGYMAMGNQILDAAKKPQLDLPDYHAMFGWYQNYCKAHPLDKFGRATQVLWMELVNKG